MKGPVKNYPERGEGQKYRQTILKFLQNYIVLQKLQGMKCCSFVSIPLLQMPKRIIIII